MKKRIKRNICVAVALASFLMVLGFAGGMELGEPIRYGVVRVCAAAAVSFGAAWKGGLFL